MESDKDIENGNNIGDYRLNRPKHGLGRGLDALFQNKADESSITSKENKENITTNNELKKIAISDIYPHASQPRRRFDDKELKELAQSIVDQGILQPLLIRIDKTSTNKGKNIYKIIAGERRWRAAQIANLHTVPAIILDLNEEEVLKVSLIENIQRSSLSPVEEAKALQSLLNNFNHTQESLARVVGKSRSYIANNLRILTLTEKVLHLIEENNITVGHARNFVGLEENYTITLIKEIKDKGISVRECEKIVAIKKNKSGEEEDNKLHQISKRIEVGEIEEKLGLALGFKVILKLSTKSKGSISLLFENPKNLNMLIDLLLSKQNK